MFRCRLWPGRVDGMGTVYSAARLTNENVQVYCEASHIVSNTLPILLAGSTYIVRHRRTEAETIHLFWFGEREQIENESFFYSNHVRDVMIISVNIID